MVLSHADHQPQRFRDRLALPRPARPVSRGLGAVSRQRRAVKRSKRQSRQRRPRAFARKPRPRRPRTGRFGTGATGRTRSSRPIQTIRPTHATPIRASAWPSPVSSPTISAIASGWRTAQLLRDAHTGSRPFPACWSAGRLDPEAPLTIAQEVARAWPASDLVIVDGAGHETTTPGMTEAILAAIARCALTHASCKPPRVVVLVPPSPRARAPRRRAT